MYNSYTLYIVYVHIYMVYCIIISYTTYIIHTHYIVYAFTVLSCIINRHTYLKYNADK